MMTYRVHSKNQFLKLPQYEAQQQKIIDFFIHLSRCDCDL